MPQIVWNSKWKTGIKTIDEQHRHLLDLVNKLLHAQTENATDKEIEKIIFDVAQYASCHFKEEETIMKSINFPGIYEHIAEHESVQDNIVELIGLYSKNSPELTSSTVELLADWLSNHVGESDQTLATYIKNNHSDLLNSDSTPIK